MTEVTDFNKEENGESTFKRTKEEKRLVMKLDCFLMTFISISQVIKFLDQSAVSNAYVSGMKEDLSLYGNQLNYFTTFFNIGYAIMLIPSQYMITRVRPSLWLPALECLWGITTACMAAVHHGNQVYALRFFLGFFESSAYPGAVMILTAWYTPLEMASRICIYQSAQAAGSMLSGSLSAAIYTNLNGKGGLSGWRWLFVINSIITIVWSVVGVFTIPDYPDRPNPWAKWFNSVDAKLGMERNSRWKRGNTKTLSLSGFKKMLFSPLVYAFAVIYIAFNVGIGGSSYFNLWLKSLKTSTGTAMFTVQQVNLIPLAANATTIVSLWTWGFIADYFGHRWIVLSIQSALCMIPCIIMSIWDVPIGAKFFSYLFLQFPSCFSPISFAWLAEILSHDPEQRSVIYGVVISLNYAIQSWSQVLIWPAVQAPHYKWAWQTSLGLLPLSIIVVVGIHIYDIKIVTPERKAFEAAVYENDNARVVGEVDEKEKLGNAAVATVPVL